MAWRKLEDTFHSDRKIRKLARELTIPEPHAAGYVVTLWTWALLYAKDGELTKFDADDIEHGAKWDGGHGDFLHACVKVSLVDVEDSGRVLLHNWIERGGSFAEAQRKRLKTKGSQNETPGKSGNVQDFPGNSRKIQERPGKSALEESRVEEKLLCDSVAPESPGSAGEGVDPKVARDDIQEIWRHYRRHHPGAAKVLKAGRKEYGLIKARLQDYDATEIKAAIDGYHRDPFHSGDNPRGKRYQSLTLILRDISHVQAGIEFGPAPGGNGTKRLLDSDLLDD